MSLPDDTFVSQVHARVFRRDGSLFVEDLGSTNGTFLNRKAVSGPMALRKGDRLQIGRSVLEVTRVTVLRSGSATDVGKVRANNQDQLLVAEPLFAVADGMGGHAAGEVASLTAVEALRQAFNRDRTQAGLVAAGEQANRAVWDRAARGPGPAGHGDHAGGHGPGRGRRRGAPGHHQRRRLPRSTCMRQGELEQLTSDHSLVQELVDIGELSEADAAVHPQRNVLTRALGVDPERGGRRAADPAGQGGPLSAVQRRAAPGGHRRPDRRRSCAG